MTLASALSMAQSRFIADTALRTLGQTEWKHPVSAKFLITNAGDSPLVLAMVEPDCSCTLVSWTETPIPAGGQGEINVTYDAQTLGHYHKQVMVYSNAEPHVVYLAFEGEVVTAIKDYSQTHPHDMGMVRVDRSTLDFPDVRGGETPVLHLSVVNLTGGAYEPVLMHLPPWLSAQASPATIQKGGRGTIALTLHADRLPGLGLTQTSIYLSRFAGDKVNEDNELPVNVILLPDFSDLTDDQRANGPRIGLSQEQVDFGSLLAAGKKARQDIILTNNGHATLHISKLQVSHPAIGVSLKKTSIAPGEQVRLRVSLDTKSLAKGKRRPLRLLMITNDYTRPKVEIPVSMNNE